MQATPEVLEDPQAFAQFQAAQGELSSALSRLMVVVERYPELKSDANFRDLQAQLEGTENRITVARNRYIEAVQEYNGTVRRFPSNLTAKAFGYDVKPTFKVVSKFVPYSGKKVDIVNVLGDVSQEDVAGYLEFRLNGRTYKLDALADPGEPLFVIFADQTGKSTTYPSGRFLQVAAPVDGKTVVDFNKAYNPPCAFSAFTTCPLPPPQNVLKANIAAGEKFRQH